MNKAPKNRQHGLAVIGVQSARCERMNLHVARVAKRDKVVQRVVPIFPFMSEPMPVYVVDMERTSGLAVSALEGIPLERQKIVDVPVLGDQLGEVGALDRAIELARVGTLSCASADRAREGDLAGRASARSGVAGVELRRAAIARNRVALRATVLVSGLARLASNLERVKDAELRRAVLAVANFAWVARVRLAHLLSVIVGGGQRNV